MSYHGNEKFMKVFSHEKHPTIYVIVIKMTACMHAIYLGCEVCYCPTCTCTLTHNHNPPNPLFQECDLNGIQLGGMVPPHPPLAVNKPLQDQQGKQDRIHFQEDLEGRGRRWKRRRVYIVLAIKQVYVTSESLKDLMCLGTTWYQLESCRGHGSCLTLYYDCKTC